MIMSAKKIIKEFLFIIIDLFVFPSKKIEPNSLLVIRLDAIGDYVLFRNFIEILRNNRKYREYKITLLGNVAWRDLAESLDKELIDQFVWIDRKRFNKSFFYRYRKLKEITKSGYEVVVYSAYSREFYFGDDIVKLVFAEEKIGYDGDLTNISEKAKKIGDDYYTKLVGPKEEIEFEFYRNKEFFESFFGEKLIIKKPSIDNRLNKPSVSLPEYYAVLFVGASTLQRKWPIPYYAKVAEHIINVYGLNIVICGGPMDKDDGAELAALLCTTNVGSITDLTGCTNLPELCAVIKDAVLMVSNETSAPHFAVAVNTPVVVIYNGNHFGRFTPYPPAITDAYSAVCHPIIENDMQSYKKLSNRRGYHSELDIREISIERVQEKIDNMITKYTTLKRLND